MPGAQVQRDDEYLSVQIPVPNPQKVTYISAIKGMFHDIRNISRSYWLSVEIKPEICKVVDNLF